MGMPILFPHRHAARSSQSAMSMIATRLHGQPSETGMYTIVTQAVWSSQMGMSMIAKQAILSAQPGGHAYDYHRVGPAGCTCL